MTYIWESPLGRIDLAMETQDRSLRPWDSADEYLLASVREKGPFKKILTVNESFGAMASVLKNDIISCWTDFQSARNSMERNLQEKDFTLFTNSLEETHLDADLVLLKIPKSLEYFKYLLERINTRVPENTPVFAAAKSHLLPPSFYSAFEERTTGSDYSRIIKKSRLYRGSAKTSAYPRDGGATSFIWKDLQLITLPGVFSQGKLDGGTRFLLEHFPEIPEPKRIADPGCGSGILSLAALSRWPEARVIATDDSLLAVESTRLSARKNGLENRITPIQTNILTGVESSSADLVLCNPPFHQNHKVSVETGLQFIRESARILQSPGRLILVANRHLGYTKTLQSLFTDVGIFSQNKQFSLYMCCL